MNKKWLKLGLILGVIAIFVYGFIELFLLDYAAEKRFIFDKKATIENFAYYEEDFNAIHKLSKRSPNFILEISETDSVFLFLNFGNYDKYAFFDNQNSNDTLKIIIDTFLNKRNWIVKTLDSDFFLTQSYAKEYLSQFEKIYQLTKQVNGVQISNKKDVRLDIDYRIFYSNGFRYSSFYSDLSKVSLDENFIGEKLNDLFYWNYFDEGLICFLNPPWIVPNSEY